ncbi:hypothetical protein TRFO_32376 [Tritrichomonas foetus]|uniref:Uncharacterized protein n=1 Tax=Tritrichomonas foetus TaxID=1144522 RepID=A0A1J4JQ30_9EUKA|nr:hypothetical protein TRFO_32376 [Tritrichomonas foetus]|eukprot:OHT00858.1 hypothetical protein TRFO_32376 [Tritrichomonas foetus]
MMNIRQKRTRGQLKLIKIQLKGSSLCIDLTKNYQKKDFFNIYSNELSQIKEIITERTKNANTELANNTEKQADFTSSSDEIENTETDFLNQSCYSQNKCNIMDQNNILPNYEMSPNLIKDSKNNWIEVSELRPENEREETIQEIMNTNLMDFNLMNLNVIDMKLEELFDEDYNDEFYLCDDIFSTF